MLKIEKFSFKSLYWFIITAAIIILDQVTKLVIVRNIEYGEK
jgi:lipoprotein signal peptidase